MQGRKRVTVLYQSQGWEATVIQFPSLFGWGGSHVYFWLKPAVSATPVLLVSKKAKQSSHPLPVPGVEYRNVATLNLVFLSLLPYLCKHLTREHWEPDINLSLDYHANHMLSLHFQRLQWVPYVDTDAWRRGSPHTNQNYTIMIRMDAEIQKTQLKLNTMVADIYNIHSRSRDFWIPFHGFIKWMLPRKGS